jgi:hypothetical protein
MNMTCEWEFYGYPHEGCREFGPPDRFACQDEAKVAIIEEDGWPGPDPGTEIHLCIAHAKKELALNADCKENGFIISIYMLDEQGAPIEA